ncbi:MAG: hypothetical protein PHQ12_02350 [Chthoniobacteraceae bacterium]|nr:hypothetical protein [Chthoniobacteraceae bacterium]
MQLTDDQKQEVAAWIASGAKLSEVQQRLAEELGIRLTYMEARFLVDDLKLVPREPKEPEAQAAPDATQPAEQEADPAPATGGVCVEVDSIMRPGALVSGRVTFSDGVTADWSLDQMGRFGMLPSKKGYKPSQEDLAEFRQALEKELAHQGL